MTRIEGWIMLGMIFLGIVLNGIMFGMIVNNQRNALENQRLVIENQSFIAKEVFKNAGERRTP